MKQIYSLPLFITAWVCASTRNILQQCHRSGYTLKTQLYNIIKDHTVQDYAGLYLLTKLQILINSMRMTILF
jgi:hypothetical protein